MLKKATAILAIANCNNPTRCYHTYVAVMKTRCIKRTRKYYYSLFPIGLPPHCHSCLILYLLYKAYDKTDLHHVFDTLPAGSIITVMTELTSTYNTDVRMWERVGRGGMKADESG